MNLRSLALLLPLTALDVLSSGCTPDQDPQASAGSELVADGARAPAAGAVKVGLRNVGVAVYDLHVDGSFPACASNAPEVVETHFVHPRRQNGKTVRGTLAIVIADPNGLESCSLVTSNEASFRVRLDASTAMASDPDAIHQISPHADSNYDVIVNGQKLGVLWVGLPYLMALDETPDTK